MLEAKVKDMALIRLRPDLLRYAPDVAAEFGLHAQQQKALEAEDATLEETAADDASTGEAAEEMRG